MSIPLSRLFAVLLLCAVAVAADTRMAAAGLAIVDQNGQPVETKTELARRALVIGVSNYRHVSPIPNAERDAALVSRTLRELGFDVISIANPGIRSLKSSLEDYADALRSAGDAVSVVYYAGHGANIDGSDVIFATDANTESLEVLKKSSMPVNDMTAAISEAMGSGASFLFLDASRSPVADNTSTRSGTAFPTGNVGLSRTGQVDTVVMYATTPGGHAQDGSGNNGPFALALAGWMKKADISHSDMMRGVRDEVIAKTEGQQVPVFVDGLAVSFVFNSKNALGGLADEPPETRAAKVLYKAEDGALAPTYEDGSFALLVGVGDYDENESGQQAWNDLRNVGDELETLGRVLSTVHGFQVETVMDPDSVKLEAALENFINLHGPKPNARLMIMLSGHGTTTEKYGRKTAWFVPADTPAVEPRGPFTAKALSLRRIEEWSEIIEAKHVMWVFDSCFSGAAIRMIETKGDEREEAWARQLHQFPVRRVLTAGSEDEEVPAKSRFTETLTRVLAGEDTIEGSGDFITGAQLGTHLKKDVIYFNQKQGLPKTTPQSDKIVIPGEQGDIIFRIDPVLRARWKAQNN